jgi:hypothetical protein
MAIHSGEITQFDFLLWWREQGGSQNYKPEQEQQQNDQPNPQ